MDLYRWAQKVSPLCVLPLEATSHLGGLCGTHCWPVGRSSDPVSLRPQACPRMGSAETHSKHVFLEHRKNRYFVSLEKVRLEVPPTVGPGGQHCPHTAVCTCLAFGPVSSCTCVISMPALVDTHTSSTH
jgi:hypothetical protein